jgi:PKD repeat protein
MTVTARVLRRLQHDESGQALVIALAIIVIGMVVGLGAVTYALNVSGSANHDERTRAAQQAADAGVQSQLFVQSSGDGIGYKLNSSTNGFSTFSNLLACEVPEISSTSTQVVGTLNLGVSSGPCPSEVPQSCATNASACTTPSAPWTPQSNESWSESETFANPQLQGGSGQFPILFPEVVSLGCKTSDTTTGATTCNAPNSVAAAKNSYSREMTALNPTAPLQAVEGENDVFIYSSGLLGQSSPTTAIDGNIIAGNILTLPAFSTTAAPTNLASSSDPRYPANQLSLEANALGYQSPPGYLRPTLDYGYDCNTTAFQGGKTNDACATSTGASSGLFNLVQTGTASGPNPCTAGSPSTNCWLARPSFSLSALSAAGDPTKVCQNGGITYSGGNGGGVYSNVSAAGGCSNGFLSYTGSVTLTAPGTYVFCNVDVGGQLLSSGSGPIQVFIAGQGQDGCSTSGFQVVPTARVNSTGSPNLQGTTGVQIDFSDGTSGGATPYTITWNFGDGKAPCTSGCPTAVSHVYNDPAGTYIATETVTDASGLAESYAFTVIVTAPLSVATPTCSLSAASGVVCADTVSGGTPGTSGYSYSWNFGDNGSKGDGSGSGTSGAVTSGAVSGTTTSGAVTTGFDYLLPGTYQISITYTDSTGASQTAKVTLADTPLAFTAIPATPASVSLGTASSFAAATVAGGFGGYSYQWNFGDGGGGTVTSGAASGTLSTTTVPAVAYRYAYPGTYVATLTVTSADGQTAATSVTNVRVTANTATETGLTMNAGTATASPPTGLTASTTTFGYSAGTCSGGTYAYSWNFGDGTATSTAQNPTHSYSSANIYPARLTVTCSRSGYSTLSQIYVVTVVAAQTTSPLIPFSSNLTGGTPPSATAVGAVVTFVGQASELPSSSYTYSWNYGDGSTGTGATSTHTYTSAGTYTAVMTVKDGHASTASYDLTVIVTAAAPTVSAGASPNPIRVGVNVNFTATITGGTGPYASYTWNFGDGQSQTVTSPTAQAGTTNTYGPVAHTYSSAGTYLATLTVTDATGQVSSTGYAEVVSPTAQSGPPGGDFIVSGGINQRASDTASGLINGGTITSTSVDPAAFQVYMQGNPGDGLKPGTGNTYDPGAPGSFATSGSYAGIGGSSSFIDAFVIYAPLSSVNITAQPTGNQGGVFEGSAIGWNTSITAEMILQDYDLGNYPLSSVVGADSVGQTVECDNSVIPLTFTSTDLNGCS